MKFKLKEYALIAEIISAIAIVSSLIFVGVQVKQNSEINEINAYQDLTAQISELNYLLLNNPELGEVAGRLFRGERIEPGEGADQMNYFMHSAVRQGELAYRQYDKELIDEDSLFSILAPVRASLRGEFGFCYWSRASQILNSGYVEYVESLGVIYEPPTDSEVDCRLRQ